MGWEGRMDLRDSKTTKSSQETNPRFEISATRNTGGGQGMGKQLS